MFAVLLSPCTIEQQVETCQARTWEPLSTQNIVLAHPMTSLILSKMVVTLLWHISHDERAQAFCTNLHCKQQMHKAWKWG